jgi:hypothetical protein
MDDTKLADEDLATLLSATRVVIGVAAWVAPRRFGRAWTGESSDGPLGSMAIRGLGARDIALGLGTLRALGNGSSVKPWLEMQALADASDTASTVFAFRDMPPLKRWVMLATAATGCYLGVSLAGKLD